MNNEFLHSFQNLNHFYLYHHRYGYKQESNKILSSAGHPPQFLKNGNEIIKLEKKQAE